MKTSLLTSLPLFLSLAAEAATVTLAWDATTDPFVVGYHLYQGGASKSYTNMFDAGNATSISVSNIAPGGYLLFRRHGLHYRRTGKPILKRSGLQRADQHRFAARVHHPAAKLDQQLR